MRSFLGTVLQSNFGEKDWVRVFESMNLAKKKNEVKSWTNMSQWVTRDLGTWDIFWDDEFRDASASKNDQIADTQGTRDKIFDRKFWKTKFQMRHGMNLCIMHGLYGQVKKLEMFLSQSFTNNITLF